VRVDAAHDRLESLGPSVAMCALRASIAGAASEDRHVVVRGEPGTGRRWVAWTIHGLGGLDPASWVEADARQLAPSSLSGLLGAARSGTLVLRALAEADLAVRAAVASMARERAHQGPRIVATVGESLGGSAALLDRNAVLLDLPPLRDRAREDRAALLASVHDALRSEMGAGPARLDDTVCERLLDHSWPGNIRQMRNALERALIAAAGAATVAVHHLPIELRAREPNVVGEAGLRSATLAEVERAHIEHTVRRLGGNRTRAARALGISRATLINKIRAYALDV